MKRETASRIIHNELASSPLYISNAQGEYIYNECIIASEILTKKELLQMIWDYLGGNPLA